MDLQYNLILLVFGCILYYLAYESPKTDIFLYFMASMLFLVGGIISITGYGGLQVGTDYNYSITEVNNTISNITIYETPIYSDNTLYNKALGMLEILLAIYMIGIVATAKKEY